MAVQSDTPAAEKAELLLRLGMPEVAWPLIDEAESDAARRLNQVGLTSSALYAGIRALTLRARAEYLLDQLPAALTHAHRAFRHSQRDGTSRTLQARVMLTLGQVQEALGCPTEAQLLYLPILDLLDDEDSSPLVFEATIRWGACLRKVGASHEKVVRTLRSAERCERSTGDKRLIGLLRRWLGIAAIDRGDFDVANELLGEATEILADTPLNYAANTFASAYWYFAQDRGEFGLEEFADGLEHCRKHRLHLLARVAAQAIDELKK